MQSRVTISLPGELLERLDAEAVVHGVSRSELVQESIASYLGKTSEQRVADERRHRMLVALESMQALGARYPSVDGRSSLEILREVRDTDDSAPLRHAEGTDD